jgi:hypothetical protein
LTNISRRYVFPVSLFAMCTYLAGCSSGVLNPQGPIGAEEKVILFDATTIMLAVVIPVIICTLSKRKGLRNPATLTRSYWPVVCIFATVSNLQGMENENVAPGPSLGVAHKRPL